MSNETPEQRTEQRRDRSRRENARPPFAEEESRRDAREHGGDDDTPGDCAPTRHQDGSRPSSSARFLNSYSPSNSGAVSSSIRSSPLVRDSPRSSTSSPAASGAS